MICRIGCVYVFFNVRVFVHVAISVRVCMSYKLDISNVEVDNGIIHSELIALV